MKRFHLHVGVVDIEKNVRFYSALFGAQPTVLKPDYAKWMLDDPRVNFAISARAGKSGLDHLGVQVENDDELDTMRRQMVAADAATVEHENAACCYATSNKYWVQDPQGMPWEAYHTLGTIPVFGQSRNAAIKIASTPASACCAPKSGASHG
jgi:catechol 2,3-dioxygenase-like lactoylglutathione lyase family enzyme